MSEYQYYEFRAIDRPLTAWEQEDVRRLSSRVEPTPTRAVFTYSYGDFRGDPLKLLETHFDAMLYIANWGSKRLAFRFPRSLVDPALLKPYCGYDEVTVTTTEQHVVLDISFHDEDGLGWIEGEGLLDPLESLRHDILRGDLRAPYLAWLQAAQWSSEMDPVDLDDGLDDSDMDEADSDGDDPLEILPVPAGLGQLSVPLQAFVDFFAIDAELIARAAAVSAPLASRDDQIERQVAMLPEQERTAWLVRVARGEPNIDVQLMRRLREVGQ